MIHRLFLLAICGAALLTGCAQAPDPCKAYNSISEACIYGSIGTFSLYYSNPKLVALDSTLECEHVYEKELGLLEREKRLIKKRGEKRAYAFTAAGNVYSYDKGIFDAAYQDFYSCLISNSQRNRNQNDLEKTVKECSATMEVYFTLIPEDCRKERILQEHGISVLQNISD